MFEGFNKQRLAKSSKCCVSLLLADVLLCAVTGGVLIAKIISFLIGIVCCAITICKMGKWTLDDLNAFPHIHRDFRRNAPVYREGHPEENTTMAECYIWLVGCIAAMMALLL